MVILIDTDKINKKATADYKKSKYARKMDLPKTVWFEGKGNIAIVKGADGYIVTDNECVHNMFKTAEEKVALGFYRHEKTKEGQSFGIFPHFQMHVTIAELLQFAKKDKMEWKKWVHLFGSTKDRMIANYRILRESFREIGATDKLPEWGK